MYEISHAVERELEKNGERMRAQMSTFIIKVTFTYTDMIFHFKE